MEVNTSKQQDIFWWQWGPVVAVVLLAVWRIFVPGLQANSGLGWDGYKYYMLAVDGINSPELDSYYIMRMFPSLLIHSIFKLLGIAFSPENVIIGFKVMSTILITLAAAMVRGIFNHFKLRPISYVTGFGIVFLNYGVLNFTYYYPVMTDTPAIFLSIALFYFFIKGELLNIALISIMGAFTWPVITVMGIALIIFPYFKLEEEPLPVNFKWGLSGALALYAIAVGWYLVYHQHERPDIKFTLPISEGMLPLSFACFVALFAFMPWVLNNTQFIKPAYWLSALNVKRIVAVIIIAAVFIGLRSLLTFKPASEYTTLYHQVKIHLLYAFVRPFITIFSHVNYWGVVMLLVIIFWNRFSAFVATFGLGFAGIMLLNLAFFGMKPESRALAHFFPWLMILAALYIDKFEFHKLFYGFAILVNLATSKIWLFFNDTSAYINLDGTINGQAQLFFMHLGIWMTEKVWLVLGIATLLCIITFTLILYRLKWENNSLVFYTRYKSVD